MKDIRIFLGGDVMTGRGLDQILSHPCKPQLYESYVKDARDYVLLAEAKNGKIHYPVALDYIWGDALSEWAQLKPHARIINLETAITQCDDYSPDKGIHYRMHPLNIGALTSAGIDICTLANNHLLDFGQEGLKETIKTLKEAKIQFAGAGENNQQAMRPAIIELDLNKRVLVFSAGSHSSGVPPTWNATFAHPGIYYLPDFSDDVLRTVVDNINQYRQPNDLIIFSIHWGSNWGYDIPEAFRDFSHQLIDIANVDIIFGHSSHHPRPIEMYHGKPILFGCGDFINDYEGICGYEEYRGDLSLMYFLDFDGISLQFKKMTLVPLQMKKFRLTRANQSDSEWMLQTLNQSAALSVQFMFQDQYLVYDV